MLATALDGITKFINSPGGVITAGAALAMIVWRFFERVESVLTEQTKLEIAVWLLGVRTADHVPWPETFAKVFDRVFGRKHLSWKCFLRSSLASYASVICTALVAATLFHIRIGFPTTINLRLTLPELVVSCVFANVLPDYISLLETRFVMKVIGNTKTSVLHILWLTVDFVITYAIGLVSTVFVFWSVLALAHHLPFTRVVNDAFGMLKACVIRRRLPGIRFETFWFFPAFFTSIWLWLYAGSGFLLKASRRFDFSFGWFLSKADIEKKPLQSIGLVASAIVAVVYWAAVGISRML